MFYSFPNQCTVDVSVSAAAVDAASGVGNGAGGTGDVAGGDGMFPQLCPWRQSSS